MQALAQSETWIGLAFLALSAVAALVRLHLQQRHKERSDIIKRTPPELLPTLEHNDSGRKRRRSSGGSRSRRSSRAAASSSEGS